MASPLGWVDSGEHMEDLGGISASRYPFPVDEVLLKVIYTLKMCRLYSQDKMYRDVQQECEVFPSITQRII